MDADAQEKIASIAADVSLLTDNPSYQLMKALPFPFQLKNSVPVIDPRTAIQMVIDAIYRHLNPTMHMIRQPNSEYRFRYLSEGLRFLKRIQDSQMDIGVCSYLNWT